MINNFRKCSHLEKKGFLILYIISTSYFLWQHYMGISWDFAVYILNGKYIFSNGAYFEIFRPPLASFLLWFFHLFFGWTIAEYVFILFTSSLFLLSSLILARALNFNPLIFYSLFLGTYVLRFALVNGTELLNLAFIELSIAMILSQNISSGLFLSLSALTRYSGLAMFPLLLFNMNLKKIILSTVFFCLVLAFWFSYNYYLTGNFFTSIADQYANNILLREGISQAPQINHFISVFGFLLPLFIIGLFTSLHKFFISLENLNSLKSFFSKHKALILITSLLSFALWSYFSIPIKHQRYLFTAILPIVYFSYIGLEKILDTTTSIYNSRNFKKKLTFYAALTFFALNIATLAYLHIFDGLYFNDTSQFSSAAFYLQKNGLDTNQISSNGWVYLNYFGVPSQPFQRREDLSYKLEEGVKVVFFTSIEEPDYVQNKTFLDSFPIIYENNKYKILGYENISSQTGVYDSSFLESVKEYTNKTQGVKVNINPCFVLFHSSSFFEKTCNFINFRGFKQDENRNLPK